MARESRNRRQNGGDQGRRIPQYRFYLQSQTGSQEMNRRILGWIAVATLLLGAEAHGADAVGKGGIVKGTITIAGKPTADVVVSVEGVPLEIAKARLAAAKSKKALVDQRGMKFIPFVLPVVVGRTVEFPNNDKSWHNVFSKSDTKKFDLGLYAPGKSRSQVFDKSGVVRVLCNAHPSMGAFIVVKEHPYISAPHNCA